MDWASLSTIVARHGYPAIAIIIGLESMGLPLPGETTLITAAIYAGSTHVLAIGPLVASAAAGAIAGDAAGFWIGQTLGAALILKYGSRLHLTPERLAVGRHLFDRHGSSVVFFGRFIAVMRTVTALLAGVNRMPWQRFLLFNAAGGFVWASAIGLGAYELGHRIERVQGIVGVLVLTVAVAVALVAFIWTRRYESRLVARVDPQQPVLRSHSCNVPGGEE